MPPKVGSSAAMASTSFSTILSGHFEVEHVDAGEFLEQDGLALHHRLGRERADVAEAEHGGAVGDDGDEILPDGVIGGAGGIFGDGEAGRGDAGRIGQRQVALVAERFCRATISSFPGRGWE